MTPRVFVSSRYIWPLSSDRIPPGCCNAPTLQYDFFPCQHQLYSYGKGKGQMWYEPVFKAITLDGQQVWRRRRYRVRRGKEPGTFYYSVLDNGVTSNEVDGRATQGQKTAESACMCAAAH